MSVSGLDDLRRVTPEMSHEVCQTFVNGAAMTDLANKHALRKDTVERIIRANMQALCQAVVDYNALLHGDETPTQTKRHDIDIAKPLTSSEN